MRAFNPFITLFIIVIVTLEIPNVEGFCDLAPVLIHPGSSTRTCFNELRLRGRNLFGRMTKKSSGSKSRTSPHVRIFAVAPTPIDESPETSFVGLKRVPIKESLREYGTDTIISDQPWLLTAVALAHYALVPSAFVLGWTLFSNSAKLGSILSALPSSDGGIVNADPTFSVFLILIGHLLNMGSFLPFVMHEYEYWQIAEMKDPVSEQTGIVPTSSHNNQRLYTIAITMMLNCVGFGNYLVAAGVFGVQTSPLLQLWGLLTLVVIFVGPDYPETSTVFPSLMERFGMEQAWNYATNGGRPAFPVPAWKFLFFILNTTLGAAALVQLLGSASTTPFAAVPLLRSIPVAVIAPVPLIISSFGGTWEGIVAETRFDQRHHLLAASMLSGGYFLFIPFYQNLLQ